MIEENRSWHEDSEFREKIEAKKRKEAEEAKKLEEEKKKAGVKPGNKQRRKSDGNKPVVDPKKTESKKPKSQGISSYFYRI